MRAHPCRARIARCCSRSAPNRYSPPQPCGHGLTPPPRRGRSRRCVETPPTTDSSPKPLPTRTSWATCPNSRAFRQAHARKLDLPTYPFEQRQYWFRDNREQHRPATARCFAYPGRPPSRGRPDRGTRGPARRCERRPCDPQCADKACGTTQPATQHQSIADDRYEFRWEKSSTRDPAWRPTRNPAWLLIGDDSEAVRPLVDVLTARGHRHQIVGLPVSDADEESSRTRCAPQHWTIRRYASCMSRPSTPTGARPHRRCGHCCGCNTASLAERGGCSAPRSPPNCARPSGW